MLRIKRNFDPLNVELTANFLSLLAVTVRSPIFVERGPENSKWPKPFFFASRTRDSMMYLGAFLATNHARAMTCPNSAFSLPSVGSFPCSGHAERVPRLFYPRFTMCSILCFVLTPSLSFCAVALASLLSPPRASSRLGSSRLASPRFVSPTR